MLRLHETAKEIGWKKKPKESLRKSEQLDVRLDETRRLECFAQNMGTQDLFEEILFFPLDISNNRLTVNLNWDRAL